MLLDSTTPRTPRTPRTPPPETRRTAHVSYGSLALRAKRGISILLLVTAFFLGTDVAQAHGPTIEISHSEMKPALLNLYVGTTVHFSNTVAMPGGHVVVDESGTLESPPLSEPGEGWHYTFETAGTYEIYLKQHPKVKARIVVVPRKTP